MFDTVTTHPDGARTVVVVHGELGADTDAALSSAVHTAVATGGSAPVVLDLRLAHLAYGRALTALVAAHAHCRRAGSTLHLVSDVPRTVRLLRVAGVGKLIPLTAALDPDTPTQACA